MAIRENFTLATFCAAFVLLFGSSLFAQTDPQILEQGTPVERELKGSESRTFAIQLAVDQFIRVKTEQKGIDVVVKLIAENGDVLLEVDSPNGTKGEELLLFIAETAGTYRIEIASVEKAAPSGRFEITLVESRPADTNDQHAAGRSMALHAQGVFGPDNQKARKLAFRALDLAERSGNKLLITGVLSLIGNTYAVEGDLEKALAYQQKALVTVEPLDNRRTHSNVLNNLGMAYSMLGDDELAIKNFYKSFELKNSVKEGKVDAGVMLLNIGDVYRGRRDFGKAMAYFARSAAQFEEAGEKEIPANLHISLAGAYRDQGNVGLAAAHYEKALSGFERAKRNFGVMKTLDGLGALHYDMGDYARSIEFCQRAVAVEEKLNARRDLAGTLQRIGDAYVKVGDYANAEKSYEKALGVLATLVELPSGTPVLIAMSRMRVSQGKAEEAIQLAERARVVFESSVGHGENSDIYFALGQAYLANGDGEKAGQYLQTAIENIESIFRNAIGDDGLKSGLISRNIAPYMAMIELSRSRGLNELAFLYAEKAKSRTIVDAFQNSKLNIASVMTQSERQREQQLRYGLVSLNTQLSKAREKASDRDETLARLARSIEAKRLELEHFRTRIYAAHPELRVHRGEMKPISLSETGRLMPDTRTVIAEFIVAEDKTYLILITNNALGKPLLKSFSSQVKYEELAKRIAAYRSKIAAGDLDFQAASRDLYDLLLKPAEKELAGKTNIIIVPDGPLWDLPFQALMDEKGKYLVERAAVSYAPSLTALREMRKKAMTRKPSPEAELLAFGNPIVAKETSERVQRVFMNEKLEPLPEAERLVNELGRLYGPTRSRIFTGNAAREETAKTEAPKYRIVQFATHGILNNVSPMYSHLVMSQDAKSPNEDGLLEAWELKDLDLKADMVILTACETARGKIANGEGMIGMTWASFIAGAPTTVASQWKVESSSTTELMLEFHRGLLSAKKISKAEALRRASLKLMKMPKYRHPSYWAGFVIVGDGS